jgi:hypothetical protein
MGNNDRITPDKDKRQGQDITFHHSNHIEAAVAADGFGL